MLRSAILAAADSPRVQALRRPLRDAARRRALRRRRDAGPGGRHAPPPERAGPANQHDAARRERARPGRGRAGDRDLRGGAAPDRGGAAPDERRGQADAPRGGLDEELGYANIERLVAEAARLGNFIRIDMEDSPLVDVTLRIYRRLREAGHDNVGTVLQAYLSGRPTTSSRCSRWSRTCASSRARTRSLRRSRTRRRPTSTPPTTGSSRVPRSGHVHGRRDTRRARIETRSLSAPAPIGWSSRCSTASGRSFSSTSSAAATGSSSPRLRARLVPVPDAAARRAAGEPALLRQERPGRLTDSFRETESGTGKGTGGDRPKGPVPLRAHHQGQSPMRKEIRRAGCRFRPPFRPTLPLARTASRLGFNLLAPRARRIGTVRRRGSGRQGAARTNLSQFATAPSEARRRRRMRQMGGGSRPRASQRHGGGADGNQISATVIIDPL